MSKKITTVKAKNNKEVLVMCGLNQANYTDSDVWRFTSELYADISAYSGADVSTKDRYQNTLKVLLDAFNEKYSADLNASDYDIKSGKFDRTTKPAIQEVAQMVVNVPVMATADKTPIIPNVPINADLINWIKATRESGADFDSMRKQLSDIGNSKEVIDTHFLSAFPVPK